MENSSDNLINKTLVNPTYILENIGELIIIIDKDSKFLYSNPSYCQLFCVESTDLVGKDYLPEIHYEDIDISESALKSIEESPYTCYVERREKTKHGWRWIAWSKKATKGGSGDIESIVCVGRDITDKRLSEEQIKLKSSEHEGVAKDLKMQNLNYGKITKELVKRNNKINELYELLKESEERFRNMFAKHSSIMLLADPNSLDIVDANLTAQQFYGYSEDEFVTKNLADLHVEPIVKVITKIKKAEKSKKRHFTSVHRLANGKKRDVEIHSVTIIYEKEEVVFSVVHDITTRIKTKKKLEHSEAMLREANQAKDKFFSIIAHDLKNPFNAILGLSDYLLSNYSRLKEEKIIEFLGNINKVSSQTYALLENLLQWAKTQMGKLEVNIEAININEVVNDEILLVKNTANSKEIKLFSLLEEEYFVYADKNMIATVIRNLLANAIKFSYRGGKVIIHAEKTKEILTISITDEGEGISEKSLNKIFNVDEAYTRTGTENEKGTGLGLVICKEFVENCKGKIGVESKKGKGSRFYFKLPLV